MLGFSKSNSSTLGQKLINHSQKDPLAEESSNAFEVRLLMEDCMCYQMLSSFLTNTYILWVTQHVRQAQRLEM